MLKNTVLHLREINNSSALLEYLIRKRIGFSGVVINKIKLEVLFVEMPVKVPYEDFHPTGNIRQAADQNSVFIAGQVHSVLPVVKARSVRGIFIGLRKFG